jgi:hypothetical protein
LLELDYHVPPGTANKAIVTGYWLSFRYDIIIIIIIIIFILVITFIEGIYNYIPQTNPVSTMYSVTAVLYLQSVLHVMLFPMLSMFRTFTLAPSASSSSSSSSFCCCYYYYY